MKYTVYIDGQEGTTGLQLRQRLEHHPYVTLLLIHEDLRKDEKERKRLLNMADVVFLCLPDDAAREAVSFIDNPHTCVIDASTAHRTHPLWSYGFPELSALHREKVKTAKRIANPGCHATGFIAAAYPLLQLGILPRDYPFSIHSITGYSGGGKSMIAQYDTPLRPHELDSPRQYALSQNHKHLPEMMHVPGLTMAPIFVPIVSDFYSGMATSIPLHSHLFTKKTTKGELFDLLTAYYATSPLISVALEEDGFLAANTLKNTDCLTLFLSGNDERMTLTAVFDNLGKGASGAAVQNMNIALGLSETESLTLQGGTI